MCDVVIVPCYERPHYTWLCLDYLSKARGIQDKDVWLCQDYHENDSVDVKLMHPVFQKGEYLFGNHFDGFLQAPHNTYGNSKNIIDSLERAYECEAERVFLIEDDIMVAPDIFEWHEAVLEDADPFVSCATALNKSAHFQINGPQVMDETYQDSNAYLKVVRAYSSHAAAFKRKNLGDALNHIEVNAKNIAWRSGHEQDLYMQVIMSHFGGYSVWPFVPRAVNVGWRSYHINTGAIFNGTLEEKVRVLDEVIHDPIRLRDMSANNQAVTAVPKWWPERTGSVKNVQKFR